MSFPGYLQDLAELIDDCLLPMNNQDPPLISGNHSPPATKSTLLYSSELSESTLADLLLLSSEDMYADTAEPQLQTKITGSLGSSIFIPESSQESDYKGPSAKKTSILSTPSTISPQLIDDFDISDQDLPHISPITTNSECSHFPRVTKMELKQPSSINLALEMGLDVPDQQPSLGLPVEMKEYYPTGLPLSTSQSSQMELDANTGSQLPHTDTTEMDLDTKPECNLAARSDPVQGEAHPGRDPSTTLAVRTTEDVIADLRRSSVRRQARIDNLSFEGELKSNDSISYIGHEDEDSDLEDHLPVPKQRKITERKKRLNAIAESFMQKRNEKLIKVRDK